MARGTPLCHVVFVRSAGVVRRDVGGETVLVPVAPSGSADLEYLYRMNPVGAAVWDALDGSANVAGVVDRVVSRFDPEPVDPGFSSLSLPSLSRDTVEADVLSFMLDLEEAKLVARLAGADASQTDPIS